MQQANIDAIQVNKVNQSTQSINNNMDMQPCDLPIMEVNSDDNYRRGMNFVLRNVVMEEGVKMLTNGNIIIAEEVESSRDVEIRAQSLNF